MEEERKEVLVSWEWGLDRAGGLEEAGGGKSPESTRGDDEAVGALEVFVRGEGECDDLGLGALVFRSSVSQKASLLYGGIFVTIP